MNIFRLDDCPIISAQDQCDKHVVKMIVESAQMLSTAHRMIDGTMEYRVSEKGRRLKYYRLDDAADEELMYKAVHHGHPSTLWTMESSENYEWHYKHFVALCDEYTYRYGKEHATDLKLRSVLSRMPHNIHKGPETPIRLAMGAAPECIDENDRVKSYRDFYQTKQGRFKMIWTGRNIPSWFKKETV